MDALIAKNRPREAGQTLRLHVKPDGQVVEVAAGDVEVEERKARTSRFEGLKTKVLQAVRGGNHSSGNAIHRVLGGRKSDVFDALRELREQGVVRTEDGALRAVDVLTGPIEEVLR